MMDIQYLPNLHVANNGTNATSLYYQKTVQLPYTTMQEWKLGKGPMWQWALFVPVLALTICTGA